MTTDPTAPDADALLKRLMEKLAPNVPETDRVPKAAIRFNAPGVGPLAQLERGAESTPAPALQHGGPHVPGLVVCRADEYLQRRIAYCPHCRTKRRFVGQHAIWHGTRWTCCGCGDSWDEGGYRQERPFLRGWRASAIARAKEMWDAAGPYDPKAFASWCEDQLGVEPLREGA